MKLNYRIGGGLNLTSITNLIEYNGLKRFSNIFFSVKGSIK